MNTSRAAAYCGTCPHWQERETPRDPDLPILDYAEGICRRNPPALVPDMRQTDGEVFWTITTMFAVTEERQFCGEHPGRRTAAIPAWRSVRAMWYALLTKGAR